MMERRSEEVATETGDCEFVPPPRLPETWGLAWERQMLATLAWQTAVSRLSERPQQDVASRH